VISRSKRIQSRASARDFFAGVSGRSFWIGIAKIVVTASIHPGALAT
jgi:hypothetical protein